MDRRKKDEEGNGLTGAGWMCVIAPEIRVMAASGLWVDIREGLDQAGTLCKAVLEKRAGAWCGREQLLAAWERTSPPSSWRTTRGGTRGQGGERP